MVAGFYYNITATGGVEGRYRKKVDKGAAVHQPIRIANYNLSFTFLRGKHGTAMTAPTDQILLELPSTGLGMSCELASSQQLYAIGTMIRILQMRKLQCIGIKKHA